MPTRVTRNERSWAITMISDINIRLQVLDLRIVRLGGENTISENRERMFPDVLLYGDEEQTQILQGWELKLPDTSITDTELIRDAQRKAVALGLNSCFIWNFTAGVLYIRDDDGRFTLAKQWNETSHIRTREDVGRYRNEWLPAIENILLEINDYLTIGTIHGANLGDMLSDAVFANIIERNKSITAEALRQASVADARLRADLTLWWRGVKDEYAADEHDIYCAYAKTVLIKWITRILFSHLIKTRHNAARMVETIRIDTEIHDANQIFDHITEACDHFNIFNGIRYDEFLPAHTWADLMEFNEFLTTNGIERIDQRGLQNVLERTVASARRELNGQYSTPEVLAEMLVNLSVLDWTGPVLDPCCGTGTIAKAFLQAKRTQLSDIQQVIETVWAADKYSFPLQLADIAMTDMDVVNYPCRLFQKNAFALQPGEELNFTDPITGSPVSFPLPLFQTIASNLPFIAFENISEDEKRTLEQIRRQVRIKTNITLSKKSDYYFYIPFVLHQLLRENGRLGIITSNSWLGTSAGRLFFEALGQYYKIEQLHISGCGRWFDNADVITVISILSKRDAIALPAADETTTFCTWHKGLSDLVADEESRETITASSLLGRQIDANIISLRTYSHNQIRALEEMGLSLSSLFHDVSWLLALQDRLTPITRVFNVVRGERKGWDKMFYPKEGHGIEEYYIKRVLHSSRAISTLRAQPDRDAFCCSASLDELRARGHLGALAWIARFEHEVNGRGRPLPEVLPHKNTYWYQMTDNNMADIVTTMNPDKRLFFARFDEPTFINQRLIGLKRKAGYDEISLYHALLNSVLGMFFIEAAGFGRGLGALDIRCQMLRKTMILDPSLLTNQQKAGIQEAFRPLLDRPIGTGEEELMAEDRRRFDLTVLSAYGAEQYYERIKDSLCTMLRMRLAR